MENNLTAITEEAVDNLMNFAPEIFDEHLIRDISVRRAVCRQLLADSAFIEFAQSKFDLDVVVSSGVLGGRRLDFGEIVKSSMTITVGLTNAQKAVLSANNPDISLTYRDAVSQPHALAYAQRKIDTFRCKSYVNYRTGTILDIGGNYATHAMKGSSLIHSCTLLVDVEEMHRQIQRDVLLSLADIDPPNYCKHGVETCDVAAEEGICLHTLPRIDPKLLPHIFRRHGLRFLTGVHHYDPAMDYADEGYMPGVEMHWKLNKDTQTVEHYFENDSSFSYEHRLDWLQQYSHTNYFSEDSWSFVIYYSVNRLENGILAWTMVKMEKTTLGTQELQPQYRYIDTEEKICLMVPVFDENLGFNINDPRAYNIQRRYAPLDLFAFVYKAGISNDTERPDLPITFDRIRDLVQTYNYVRKINGTSITTSVRMSTLEANDIARGIYLVVVQRAAHVRVVNTTYTNLFLRMQKRWGNESFSYLLSKCFASVVLSPFMLFANSFDDLVDLMAVHMRATIAGSRVIASVHEELPYHLLSPVTIIPGTATQSYEREITDIVSSVDIESEPVDLMRFYDIFRDQLSPHHQKEIEQRIVLVRQQAETQVANAIQADDDFPIVAPTRESWDEAMQYLGEKVPIKHQAVAEASSEDVMDSFALKIYEAGLHNYDIALGVTAAAKERCFEFWTGTGFNQSKIDSRNVSTNLEMKFLKVSDRKIVDNQHAEDYVVCMDPNTHELLNISNDSNTELNTQANYVFVMDSFKIFNNFQLGNKLVLLARSIKQLKPITFVLVDGVPGCGKTHEIVENVSEDDLIACAVRDTAMSTRARVLKKNPRMQSSRIRTSDSLVMHSVPRAKTLWCDEGLMMLPGVVNYIAYASKAQCVRVLGDSAQIGFVDRGSKLGILRFPYIASWNSIEYRNVTMRLPLDACLITRTFYPEWRRKLIKTCSSVRRSVSFETETDIDSVKYKQGEPNVNVLTFLQADKGKILTGKNFIDAKRAEIDNIATVNKSPVLTVHESQGGDYNHVSVMRMNAFTAGVFDMKTHQLVALSRHVSTLRIISVLQGSDDPLFRLARIAIDATDEQLDECSQDTPEWLQAKIDNVKLRGILL